MRTDTSASLRLSGKTRLLAMVGHPIAQVRAPGLITEEFHRRDIDAVLVPCHVRPENFDILMAALMRLENLAGLLITVPYKPNAAAIADDLGLQARRVGAVSAMVRRPDGTWLGEAFDGIGCLEALERRGVPPAGKHVMLLGCGGAGRSIAFALAAEGVGRLCLVDTDVDRAHALQRSVAKVEDGVDISVGTAPPDKLDILINASPVGMKDGSELPVDLGPLRKDLVVFDIVARQGGTQLLTLARESGCKAVDGLEMMHAQNGRIVDFMVEGWGIGQHAPIRS